MEWVNVFIKKHPKIERIMDSLIIIIVLGSIMGFAIAVVEYGSISRDVHSAIPWQTWQDRIPYGYLDAITAVGMNLMFLLWAFIIPAQMYASNMYKKSERRPIYPYVINFLIGVILLGAGS